MINPGIIGGILGSIIGIAGGAFGTYCSIKGTNGPRERSFMIKYAVFTWIFVITFLVLFFVLPKPYNLFMWIPYAIFLPIGIIYVNKHLLAIRKEEIQHRRQSQDHLS